MPAWQRPEGFLDYAVNLIDCDPRYQAIFAYTFGSTVVFETLELARQHLGSSALLPWMGKF
jgi:chromosome segregation protein